MAEPIEPTEPAAWGEDGPAPLRPDTRCNWCDLRTSVVPNAPILWEGRWYHRTGCYPAARMKHYGYLPADYRPITEVVA